MLAKIIIPFPLKNSYTYFVPNELEDLIAVGQRVIVSFGRVKYCTGIVEIVESNPLNIDGIKPIVEIIDSAPFVNSKQLALWYKLADFCFCSVGEIYRIAVPSIFRLESESFVSAVVDQTQELLLTEKELRLLSVLQNHKVVKINKLELTCGFRPISTLKSLFIKNLVEFNSEIENRYKEKKKDFISLKFDINNSDYISDMFVSLKKSKRQVEFIEKLIDYFSENRVDEVCKLSFLKKTALNNAVAKSLVSKNLIDIQQKTVSRILFDNKNIKPYQLTENQQLTLDKIRNVFREKDVCLLHGVTSSGKTEIYIHLIINVLRGKEQALFLVPEIGLTMQLVGRLKGVFGSKLLIYHSQMSQSERYEVWKELANDNESKIVIGPRSAVFLPFKNLKLIIMDEEHDRAYVQTELPPFYNAKNAAFFLSQIHGSKLLLASATPSVETYSSAKFGKIGLVELNLRFENMQLPTVSVVDIKESYRKKRMRGRFSLELIDKISEVLGKNKQVILFQNRRGYSLMLECAACGAVAKCKKCDVSLTYHSFSKTLTCHHCGYTTSFDNRCKSCGSADLHHSGFGTEQIEKEAKELFVDAKVDRLDLNSTRKKHSFENILERFESGQTDILVGTSMISKGLDFGNVGLVAVMNVDNMLNFPDYRSDEYAFQTLLQVCGRAGRRTQGEVIVQTYSPQNQTILDVLNNNYSSFFTRQMQERSMFRYPPYCRIVAILIKHRDQFFLKEAAKTMYNILSAGCNFEILGPASPPIPKVRNMYQKNFLLKIDNSLSYLKIGEILKACRDQFFAQSNTSSVKMEIRRE